MKLRLIVMVVFGAVCAAVGIVRGADAGETLPRDARAELARELFEPVSFNGERKKSGAPGSPEAVGTNNSDKSNSDQGGEFVVCEECKGRKTVPNEVICSKCNGAGSFVRQTRIKDLSGNALPAKEVRCSKCNGKGVISVGRKPCEACDGKGRVPR